MSEQAIAVQVQDALPIRSGVLGYGPADLEADMKTAEMLAASGILPDYLTGKPAALMAVVLKGRELGLDPMQSIGEIHVVKGKTVLSAALIQSLAMRSGVCEYFRMVSVDSEQATFETKRVGDPEPTRYTYTIAHAEKAGLTRNPTWTRHRESMLIARCRSFLARVVYPDAVGGLYETDEGREIKGEYDMPRQPSRAPVQAQPIQQPVQQRQQTPPPKAELPPVASQVAEVFKDAEIVDEVPTESERMAMGNNQRDAIMASVIEREWGLHDLNAFLRSRGAPCPFGEMNPQEVSDLYVWFVSRGGLDAMGEFVLAQANAR